MVPGLTLGYITSEESETSVSDNYSVSKRKRGISRLASRQEKRQRQPYGNGLVPIPWGR